MPLNEKYEKMMFSMVRDYESAGLDHETIQVAITDFGKKYTHYSDAEDLWTNHPEIAQTINDSSTPSRKAFTGYAERTSKKDREAIKFAVDETKPFDADSGGYDNATADKYIKEFPLTIPKPDKYQGDYVEQKDSYQAWVWHPEEKDYKKHSGSLDPQTGMILKGRNHPTWHLMEEEEKRRGNKIVKKADGRYYSVDPRKEETQPEMLDPEEAFWQSESGREMKAEEELANKEVRAYFKPDAQQDTSEDAKVTADYQYAGMDEGQEVHKPTPEEHADAFLKHQQSISDQWEAHYTDFPEVKERLAEIHENQEDLLYLYQNTKNPATKQKAKDLIDILRAGSQNVDVEKLQDALSKVRRVKAPYLAGKSYLSGYTVGLSDIALMDWVEEAILDDKVVAETLPEQTVAAFASAYGGFKGIQKVAKGTTFLANQAHAVGLKATGKWAKFLTNEAVLQTTQRMGTAGAVTATRGINQLISDAIHGGEEIKNPDAWKRVAAQTGFSMAGSAISLIPEKFVTPKKLNFLSQVITDVTFDVVTDYSRGRMDKGTLQWILTEELPQLALSGAMAMRDYGDVNFDKQQKAFTKGMKDLFGSHYKKKYGKEFREPSASDIGGKERSAYSMAKMLEDQPSFPKGTQMVDEGVTIRPPDEAPLRDTAPQQEKDFTLDVAGDRKFTIKGEQNAEEKINQEAVKQEADKERVLEERPLAEKLTSDEPVKPQTTKQALEEEAQTPRINLDEDVDDDTIIKLATRKKVGLTQKHAEDTLKAIGKSVPEKFKTVFKKLLADTIATFDKDAVDKMISRALKKPTALSDRHEAQLLVRKTQLDQDMEKISDELAKAEVMGDKKTISDLKSDLEDTVKQIEDIETVSHEAGSEWGKSGAFRQMLLDNSTFSLERILAQARKNRTVKVGKGKLEKTVVEGGKITPQQEARYKAQAEKIKTLQAEVDEFHKAKVDEENKNATDTIKSPKNRTSIAKIRAEGPKKVRQATIDDLIKLKGGKKEQGSVMSEDVKEADLVKKLANTYQAEGEEDLFKITEAIQKDYKDNGFEIDERTIIDHLGDKTKKRANAAKKNAIKEKNQLTAVAKVVSDVYDFFDGKLLPKAIADKIEKTTADILRSELKEMKKLANHSKMEQAELVKWHKKVADLEDILAGRKNADATKPQKEVREELQKLKDQVTDLRQQVTANKTLEELETEYKNLKEGIITAKKVKSRGKKSPELIAKQEQVKAKKAEIAAFKRVQKWEQKLQDVMEGKIPRKGIQEEDPAEVKRIKEQIADIEGQRREAKAETKRIATLEKQIQDEIDGVERTPTAQRTMQDSEKVTVLKKRLQQVRKQRAESEAQEARVQKLEDKITLARRGDLPARNKLTPKEVSDLESRLKAELKELERNVEQTARTEQERQDLMRKLSELQGHLDSGFRSKKKGKRTGDDLSEEETENQFIKGVIEDARKQLRIDDKIREIDERLRTGNLEDSATAETKSKWKSETLQKKRKELTRAKRKLQMALHKEKTALLRQGRNVLDALRAIKATADMSYALRQGLILNIGSVMSTEPGAKGGDAFIKAFQAMLNENNADDIMDNLLHSPKQWARDKAGLELFDIGAGDNGLEYFRSDLFAELAESRIAQPGGGWNPLRWPGAVMGASERNMAVGINMLRASYFDAFRAKQGRFSDEQSLKDYAKFLNLVTGTGSRLDKFKTLELILFAPRFTMSKFELAYKFIAPGKFSFKGKDYDMGGFNKTVKKEVAKEFAKTAVVAVGALGLAAHFGLDVALDPNDPDYLKIKQGNRRWDILGGYQQPTRLLMKEAIAIANVLKGERYENKRDLLDEINKFLKYKRSVPINLYNEYSKGKNIMNEDRTVYETTRNAFLPLTIQSLLEDTVFNPTNESLETKLGAFAFEFVGGGSYSYESGTLKSRGRKRRKRRTR